MKTITKPLENLGGLLRIWAIPKNVFTLTGKDLTFSDTSEIVQLYCTPGSMSMEEKEERTRAGSYFQNSVKAFVPKDTEEVRAVLDGLKGKPVVILVVDGNGSYKLAGSSESPLRLTASFTTGQSEQQPAGHEILFSGKSRQRSLFVNPPF